MHRARFQTGAFPALPSWTGTRILTPRQLRRTLKLHSNHLGVIMLFSNNLVGTAILAAAVAFSTQATAHEVFSETLTLPVIASGGSQEVTITCPAHHYVVAGGYENNDQLNPTGPLVVTASYPATTRSWRIEVTNRSGRPTAINEARITLYATCDHHW